MSNSPSNSTAFIKALLREPLTTEDAEDTIDATLREAYDRKAKAIYFISTRSHFVLKMRLEDHMERLHHFSADARPHLLRALVRMAESNFEILDEEFDDEALDAPWGRIHRSYDGQSVDFRVTSLPCELGREVSIQITCPDAAAHDLDEIFVEPDQLAMVKASLKESYGLYLVAGPPHSGKVSTAWGMIQELDPEDSHVVTIESPIKYVVPGVSQMEVHQSGAPDYVDALQGLRYHRPDAVYVDSLDEDVVLTEILRNVHHGSRVISCVFTVDAAETICFLREMRDVVSPLLRGLRLIVSQRLLRRIDPRYRMPLDLGKKFASEKLFQGINELNFSKPVAGEHGDGYAGHVAAFEVVEVNEELREFLKKAPTEADIRKYLSKLPGYRSMAKNALRLVARGLTSVDEVLRVFPETAKDVAALTTEPKE